MPQMPKAFEFFTKLAPTLQKQEHAQGDDLQDHGSNKCILLDMM